MTARKLVVVDTTFLKHLDDDEKVAFLRRKLRMLDLALVPSVVNVYEALKDPNASRRDRILHAVDRWSPNAELLPWPLELLRQSANALRRGHVSFRLEDGTHDTLRINSAALHDDHETVKLYLNTLQDAFEEPYRRNREAFQQRLKRSGRPASYANMREFISAHAVDDVSLAQLAELLWDYAAVEGERLPLDTLKTSEIWRIAFDVFAAALHGRAIAKEQQRNPPGVVDLLQLMYMAGSHDGRIYVTNDRSLHEVASTIFVGRYHNARIMLEADFLAPAA